jgi:hypothetical protein
VTSPLITAQALSSRAEHGATAATLHVCSACFCTCFCFRPRPLTACRQLLYKEHCSWFITLGGGRSYSAVPASCYAPATAAVISH